ncbi:radical SAM protein [bacterium]|nr:radical SAM protein [candidate division CSSED10-310 bacterium]
MNLRRILTQNPRQLLNSIRLRLDRFDRPVCRHDPASIMVFITNRCNFRCNTCPFTHLSPWSPPPDIPDISTELFQKVLDHYRGATMVGLVGGEPLLHPDLDSLITIAASRKMTVNLSTNGSLLTDDRIRQLLSLPLGYLNISLDAVDAAEFNRLRGGSPSLYETVLKNAAQVGSIRASMQSPVRFYLSFVTDTINLRRIPEAIELARELGADTVFCQSVLSYSCSDVTSGESILLDEPGNRRFLESLPHPEDITLVPPILQPPPDHEDCQCSSCIHPFKLLAIDGAGNLSPCCVIPPHPRFGNIATDMGAWHHGEPMQRIRSEMLADETASESICLKCWERYSLREQKQ